MNDDQNAKTSNGKTNRHHGKSEAMLNLVAEVCDDHSEGETNGPGGHAIQLGLDTLDGYQSSIFNVLKRLAYTVAICLDNTRRDCLVMQVNECL